MANDKYKKHLKHWEEIDIWVATDSEWDASLPDDATSAERWICSQIVTKDKAWIFFKNELPTDVKQRLITEALKMKVEIAFVTMTDDLNLLETIELTKEGNIGLLMFFSPKDIEYGCGWTNVLESIEKGKISQKNNLSGTLLPKGQIQIKDLCGWAGKQTLEAFATSLNIKMANKKSMEDYKKMMMVPLLAEPEQFLHYCMDDSIVLLQLHDRFYELFDTVLKLCVKMRNPFHKENIPMTMGSAIAKTYADFMLSQHDLVEFCIRKLGLLDQSIKGYEKQLQHRHNIIEKYTTPKQVRKLRQESWDANKITTEDGKSYKKYMKAKYMVDGMSACSIKWWRSMSLTEMTCHNALIQGGLCLNMNPYEYRVKNGLDIDISSCYGTVLRSAIFPVGLPHFHSHTADEKPITLREWLRIYEDKLVDGLWTVTVTGNLNFSQDLVYSKWVKPENICKLMPDKDGDNEKEDDQKVKSMTMMLNKEIINGIITSHNLKVIRKVATSQELNQFMKLKVVSSAMYLKQDEIKSLEDWCAIVLADKGTYVKVDGENTNDNRTRVWYGFKMEDFVGKIIDERKHYKQQSKDMNLSQKEREQASGLSEIMKLMVNALYGSMSSPYFQISNTVVGNNITCAARTGVWQLSKALATRQVITDGGIYCPATVCAFDMKRKPGIDVISKQWEWNDSKAGRAFINLGLPSFADLGECNTKALNHIKRFWQAYGLDFNFGVEHKQWFDDGAYWSKSDYGLHDHKNNEPTYRIRGKEKKLKDKDKRYHPTYDLLDNIAGGRDIFPKDMEYEMGNRILKLKGYKRIQQSNGKKDKELKQLRPGDNRPTNTFPARYNNKHFPMATKADFDNRNNRRSVNRGKLVEFFEKYRWDSISKVHRMMALNDLSERKINAVAIEL